MLLKVRERMKKKSNQKGFTLVELIIVMAILAILTGLAVPKFSTVLSDSKYKAHNVNVDMLYKAAQLYLATNGNPGTTLTGSNAETSDVPEDGSGYKALYDNNYLESASLATPYDSEKYYSIQITNTGGITIYPGKATLSGGSWNAPAADSSFP